MQTRVPDNLSKTGIMKKLFLLLFLPCALWAQNKNIFVNAQLHRDFNREAFTSTIEIFELDKLGTTFFFTDYDYYSTGQTGSYFELARNFAVLRLKPTIANLSVQYNDGVLDIDGLTGKQIPRTGLFGVAFSNITFGQAYFELQGLARQEFGADLGWQFTGVWSVPIGHTPFQFLGYLDWFNHNYRDQPSVILAEPQLLVRSRQWAIGSELEISRNYSGAYTKSDGFEYKKWYAHPTLFVRVDF